MILVKSFRLFVLRGKLIQVIDIAVKFVLDIEKVSNRRAIIIETDDQVFAIIVDEVTEVKKLQESDIEVVHNIASGDNEYIRGIAKNGNRLIILLNAEKILDSSTLELLDKIS